MDRIRALLKDLLEMDGRFAVVGEASDGVEAVSVVEREQPDAVVLDLSMPVMGGLEALPLIRDRSPGASVVVMSSFDARQMARQALDAGADAYLEKGATVAQLTGALLQAHASRGAATISVPTRA
jgi:DNA-binding NarL/FixJ family response regulator